MGSVKLPSDFTLERYDISVRLANESDSEFILKLRTNSILSRYLHPTENDLDIQKEWMRQYKFRETRGIDYYFVFSKDGQSYGLERIYDIEGDSFTHGSLVFAEDAPFGMSILADIITREIAFDDLELKHNYFDVRKGNINVRNYHLKFKPSFLREDDDNMFYVLEKEDFEKNKARFLKLFYKG